MLTRVTITGADDRVEPQALVALSERFPFVEWGILFSASKVGQPRYPTTAWVWALASAFADCRTTQLSAHFCGLCARVTLAGMKTWTNELPLCFDRIQLNGYEELSPAFYVSKHAPSPEYILQARTLDGLANAQRDQHRIPRGSVLVDPSGGRGLDAHAMWEVAGSGDEWIGFAGGINPANVGEAVAFLSERRTGPFWIDMESGVRTDERFDLKLVTEVLEKAAPFITERG